MGQRLDEVLDFATKICKLVESLFDNTIGKLSRDFKQIIIVALKAESGTKVGNANLIAIVCYFVAWIYSISKERGTNDFLYFFGVIVFISLSYSYNNYNRLLVDKINIKK